MEAIEIARKLAALGEQGEACRAYGLVIQSGANAGLSSAYTAGAASYTYTHIGSRLCFIPSA